MNKDMLCGWLGLATKSWPPDDYTLLGLKAGEADAASIERRVQERMARLRCYQLSHPEEATEGMNRLAQAFITLTEAASKAAPPATPAATNGASAPAPAKLSGKETVRIRPKAIADTAVVDQTKVDWRLTPPPIRTPAAGIKPPAAAEAPSSPVDELQALIEELAERSSEARTGLGTLQALIDRIDQTRLLLTAWQRLGVYLRRPGRPGELTRSLETILEVSEVYPAFVGHPGKPGYRIVALARLAMTIEMFQSMAAAQRDELLRDWDYGHRTLLQHRRFLRRQFKGMRHHGSMGLAVRAVRSLLNDHPILFGTALVTLIVVCIALRFWLF